MSRAFISGLLVAIVGLAAGCKSGSTPGTTSTASSSSTGASGDSGGSGSGGSGGAGSTTTTTVTATSGSTVATTSIASTGTGPACIPLANATAAHPTPGICMGNVAVTCAKDGTLSQEVCPTGSACETYSLDEWRFDAISMWIAGRTITWAGCKPPGTMSCDLQWDGSQYNVGQAQCDGVNEKVCSLPPVPDLFSNIPQLQYGTTKGWEITTACPTGKHCAASAQTAGELTCIADGTPACTGMEPFCSQNGITECIPGSTNVPGYQITAPCPSGDVCYTGASGSPHCDAPGEMTCSSSLAPSCTASGDAWVYCNDGYTSHESCAMCPDGNGGQVPCRCDSLFSISGWSGTPTSWTCNRSTAPECVPQTEAHCDPTTVTDQCNGTVAHRCIGTWHDVDCATYGKVCDVSHGIAGCRAPNAPSCNPVQTQESCSGKEEVACCSCGNSPFLFSPINTPPCVPGYEVRMDCSYLGAAATCVNSGPFVECHM